MDADRVGAYPSGVTPSSLKASQRAAAESPHTFRRRRPPNWQEQRKREAWGRFWANVNKGAMKR